MAVNKYKIDTTEIPAAEIDPQGEYTYRDPQTGAAALMAPTREGDRLELLLGGLTFEAIARLLDLDLEALARLGGGATDPLTVDGTPLGAAPPEIATALDLATPVFIETRTAGQSAPYQALVAAAFAAPAGYTIAPTGSVTRTVSGDVTDATTPLVLDQTVTITAEVTATSDAGGDPITTSFATMGIVQYYLRIVALGDGTAEFEFNPALPDGATGTLDVEVDGVTQTITLTKGAGAQIGIQAGIIGDNTATGTLTPVAPFFVYTEADAPVTLGALELLRNGVAVALTDGAYTKVSGDAGAVFRARQTLTLAGGTVLTAQSDPITIVAAVTNLLPFNDVNQPGWAVSPTGAGSVAIDAEGAILFENVGSGSPYIIMDTTALATETAYITTYDITTNQAGRNVQVRSRDAPTFSSTGATATVDVRTTLTATFTTPSTLDSPLGIELYFASSLGATAKVENVMTVPA